jgi:hypothetical protein
MLQHVWVALTYEKGQLGRMQFYTHLPYSRLGTDAAATAGFSDNGECWERPASDELVQREVSRLAFKPITNEALPNETGPVISWQIVADDPFKDRL